MKLLALTLCFVLVAGCASQPSPISDEEAVLTGKTRPKQIPRSWVGEPLPNGQGWRWSDPKDRGNAVRFHRGDPDATNPVNQGTYVIVTVHGEIVDATGTKTGKFLHD